MITGVHVLLYAEGPSTARAFLRDVLGLPSIDSGGGWLLFAAPPAELAVHPTGDEGKADPTDGLELYFMCEDIEGTVAELKARGVEFTKAIDDEGYGLFTAFQVPGGREIGLYEPRHPTALHLSAGAPPKPPKKR
jgi:predicted enzyme related to lactoylglutathione lyase